MIHSFYPSITVGQGKVQDYDKALLSKINFIHVTFLFNQYSVSLHWQMASKQETWSKSMELKEDVKDVYKEGKSGSMDQWNGSASKGTGTLSKAFLKLLLLVTFW